MKQMTMRPQRIQPNIALREGEQKIFHDAIYFNCVRFRGAGAPGGAFEQYQHMRFEDAVAKAEELAADGSNSRGVLIYAVAPGTQGTLCHRVESKGVSECPKSTT